MKKASRGVRDAFWFVTISPHRLAGTSPKYERKRLYANQPSCFGFGEAGGGERLALIETFGQRLGGDGVSRRASKNPTRNTNNPEIIPKFVIILI